MSKTPLLDYTDKLQYEYRRNKTEGRRDGLAFVVGPRAWDRLRVEGDHSGLTIFPSTEPGRQYLHGFPLYVNARGHPDYIDFEREAPIRRGLGLDDDS